MLRIHLSKFRGFSLLELLICLSVVTILLLGTMASTRPLNIKNKREIIADEIKGAIGFAKMQSLLCESDILLKSLSDNEDWSQGMRLWRDNHLLREWQWASDGIIITWQGFQSSHYLLFSADMSRNALNGTFKIIDNDLKSSKLIVNRLGKVRIIN